VTRDAPRILSREWSVERERHRFIFRGSAAESGGARGLVECDDDGDGGGGGGGGGPLQAIGSLTQWAVPSGALPRGWGCEWSAAERRYALVPPTLAPPPPPADDERGEAAAAQKPPPPPRPSARDGAAHIGAARNGARGGTRTDVPIRI
jgi:hypothetical protein